MRAKLNSFTLIEVLITVSIIMVMSGVVLAQYNNFTNTKRISEETSKLYDTIDLAKKKALAADTSLPDGSVLACSPFRGYQLTVDTSSPQHTYTLALCCNSPVMTCTNILTNTVRKGIALTPVAKTSWIFPPLTASNEDIKITVTDTSSISDLDRCIHVNEAGLVTITNDECI